MIKRSGVEVMNARTKNVSIAKETIEICKNGSYTSVNGAAVDISQELSDSKQGTVYYPEGEAINPFPCPPLVPIIEVTNETTQAAAIRLGNLGKQDIVALNFASARNQGGGFLSGAMAQEEALCRNSGLYPCLKSKPLFYNANILCDDCYYTDGIIYSPHVPFFRDEHNLLIDNPFTLSIVTAPAPNLNAAKDVDDDLLDAKFASRTTRILEVAAAHGHKTLILGAWGCGAFGNDPTKVANYFSDALQAVPMFEHVCFAVYDTRTPPHLFEAFDEVFVTVT